MLIFSVKAYFHNTTATLEHIVAKNIFCYIWIRLGWQPGWRRQAQQEVLRSQGLDPCC